jgi:endo-1,4-beta-xylanase
MPRAPRGAGGLRAAAIAVAFALVVGASGPAAAAATHPAPIPSRSAVPLGAAVWYACTDAAYAGPAPLACPVTPFDARYGTTFAQSFDRLTPENELKMLWTQPRQGSYDFAVADRVAALARSQGKRMRGHALMYAAADPAWVDRPLLPWSRARLLAVLRDRIATVVGHYRTGFPGVVDEWDVVNEPFLGSGARDQNVYQRVIGDDWIEQAFRAANAADPDALLYLNEFDADTPGPRQRAVLALAGDFVRRGVPIDGIGLEMHVGADGRYPTLAGLKGVMAQYAALGLRVAVTELDVLRPVQGDPVLVQRAAYDTVARACQESVNCTGVTVWGVADPYSWRGAQQMADLFSATFARKRAYDLVRCRLGDPKPATGAWTPKDCGPVEVVPPATTTQPPGSTGGSSTDSAPPATP